MKTPPVSGSLRLPVFLLALTGSLAARDGVIPTAADGRALNLGFEDGTLLDWTAQGKAFEGQPIEGDTVSRRRPDMKSAHEGKFWVGSFERYNDSPTGTLTSVKFRVTHPWASFLVGAGRRDQARVEIVDASSEAVIVSEAGRERENLEAVAVDLRKHLGKEIFIRVVDGGSGPWGHVNFDDFRFHDRQPTVPPRQVLAGGPPAEAAKESPYLTPQEALTRMEVPDGFRVDLIASEPELVQPIAFCWDTRGRIWVVEGRTYPRRKGNPPAPRGNDATDLDKPSAEQLKDIFSGEDRILILEDGDGDGSFETRKVFVEKLNLVSGIELGFGGVFIGSAPYLLHFPLDAAGDKPAGDPRILTDGWGWQDTHETLNSFIWGPDGWLYGCHGVFTHSEVRVCAPGVAKDRTRINCGYWRYHPVRHAFEVFAHGTSNPWGLDYNGSGEWFSEACVIPHFWHVIEGGYYLRQSNPLGHFNPYVYTNIETIADHVHYIGATPHSGNAVSDEAGGGHAHSGLCIYNGDNFPAEYRGRPMFFNIHGQRINQEQLVPHGSGYVAKHLPDFLKTHDKNFTGVALKVGPDGAVYFIDWYDKQKCHRPQPEVWDRSNGRMYRVKFAKTWKPWTGDVAKAVAQERGSGKVPAALDHANGWHRRMARRALAESGPVTAGARADLQAIDSPEKLLSRFWAYCVSGGKRGGPAAALIDSKDPTVRNWGIRFDVGSMLSATDGIKGAAESLGRHANDPSPVIRLTCASLLQRLPLEQRWEVAERLIAHPEDAGDHNLPQMYWYAIEPLVPADPGRALALAERSKIPLVAQNIARRAAATDGGMEHLVTAIGQEKTAAGILYLTRAALDGLRGRVGVAAPKGWDGAYANIDEVAARRADGQSVAAELRNAQRSLAVAFGDKRAFPELRARAKNKTLGSEERQTAFQTLVQGKDPELGALIIELLDDPAMRLPALQALPHAGGAGQ